MTDSQTADRTFSESAALCPERGDPVLAALCRRWAFDAQWDAPALSQSASHLVALRDGSSVQISLVGGKGWIRPVTSKMRKAGFTHLRVAPRGKFKRILKHRHRLRTHLKFTFANGHGKKQSRRLPLTLVRKRYPSRS